MEFVCTEENIRKRGVMPQHIIQFFNAKPAHNNVKKKSTFVDPVASGS